MRSAVTRLALLAGLVVAAVAGALLVPVAGSTPAATARAANLSLFDPGNIISDAVFYDARSMDAPTVQLFLNLKGGNCLPGSDGTACLKDYKLTTADRAASSVCAPYQGASQESAASIITKVAVACGVSPRVLLVLLQKEMGLVTGTRPTAFTYERAAGYACPDNGTGQCDPAYAGLANQLYWAAWQYRRYQAAATTYAYRAGVYNTIQWNPSSACGTSSVFIVNQATAGLYNYTPYRPNQAALNAGYGTGDACSSYGNRNFFSYFTDWFGSTGFRVSGAISTYYIAHGGGTGSLGAPLDEMYCGLRDGGCGQDFQGGAVYWSPATGTHAVSGAIRAAWNAQGFETTALEYPTGEMFCGLSGGGCAQWFQGGAIYWSPPTGAHALTGAIGALWYGQGYETGALGYPTADMGCGATACGQSFQNGFVSWSGASGTHVTSGAINALFLASGGPGGSLGAPVEEMRCGLSGGGCGQDFTGGSVYWSSVSGTHAVSGAIRSLWAARGREAGTLGYPTADMACGLTAGGCVEAFQNGFAYWSAASGPHSVQGGIGAAWRAGGGDAGPLGYPTDEMACGTTGCSQPFQRGQLAWTAAAGVRSVTGAISAVWTSQGGGSGPLGYPLGDMDCTLTGGGCRQAFDNGSVVWSPATGAFAVRNPVVDAWTTRGAEGGSLGFPTGDMTCTSATACSQPFQGGRLAVSGAGAQVVGGGIGAVWTAQGGGSGPLGYPTTAIDCTLAGGGCRQGFEHGWIYWSPTTGAWVVQGPIGDAWLAGGGPSGSAGYPVGNQVCTSSTACSQQFQKGQLAWSQAGGAHWLVGAMSLLWSAQGAGSGPLGSPVADIDCTLPGGGCRQAFQSGSIVWSGTTGGYLLVGAIDAAWTAQNGAAGPLGYPTGAVTCGLTDGGCAQAFQGGWLYSSPLTGAYRVTGGIGAVWRAQGADKGPLGYPTAEMACANGGCYQQFQRGLLAWTPLRGVLSVGGAIGGEWALQSAGAGPLGYPVGPMTCGLAGGGCKQGFDGGAVYWSGPTGAHLVTGAIAAFWASQGSEGGTLGYPTADPVPVSGGFSQRFQGGTLTSDASGRVTRS